jgi:DNA replication protein DnaC
MSEFIKVGDALGNLGIITKKKYEHLKKFSSSALSKGDLEEIKKYEEYQVEKENNKPHFESPKKIVIPKLETINTNHMFDNFQKFWLESQKKHLQLNPENSKVIKGLCAYFGKNNDCTLDLNKGLLITGKCGVGKTSIMMTFHKMGRFLVDKRHDNFMWYRPVNCNDLVHEFEMTDTDSGVFHKKYKSGNFYFDDFGTERDASKFGKSNLMKEILENRYLDLSKRTYLTTNLTLDEIEERYGMRVRDRIYEQFNYIELSGDSFRKKL